MTKLCKCEPSRYPHTHNENEGQGAKLDVFVTFNNRNEWLKDMLGNVAYSHNYTYDGPIGGPSKISGEYYLCAQCDDEIHSGGKGFDDWQNYSIIQKAMRHPFTEEAYYHHDFKMWMGDMPSKILLTPEAADLAWNEVSLDDMKEGVDYTYAQDHE